MKKILLCSAALLTAFSAVAQSAGTTSYYLDGTLVQAPAPTTVIQAPLTQTLNDNYGADIYTPQKTVILEQEPVSEEYTPRMSEFRKLFSSRTTRFHFDFDVDKSATEELFLNGASAGNNAGENIFETSKYGFHIDHALYFRNAPGLAIEGSIGLLSTDDQAIEFSNGNIDVGAVHLFPITLGALWAPFHDKGTEFSPYIGAGYHYTPVYETFDDIKYDDTHGAYVKLGLDYWYKKRSGFNIEIKKMFSPMEADFSRALALPVTAKYDDHAPLIISLGFSIKY